MVKCYILLWDELRDGREKYEEPEGVRCVCKLQHAGKEMHYQGGKRVNASGNGQWERERLPERGCSAHLYAGSVHKGIMKAQI